MNDAKRHSVLIVDDENSNIMALTHILSPEYTIYAAKSGASALAAVEKYSPDVILLDIVMPEMDGYDVIAALKASEKSSGIPVVFVTGLSNADDEEKGLILGAADYIAKP
ncbi:MAG: response regulator, partial [Oscillospiraceae bacterium]|nr:response regulator [Oscillospiraceae bacterium]